MNAPACLVSLSFHEPRKIEPADTFIGTLTQYCTIDNIEKHEGMEWYMVQSVNANPRETQVFAYRLIRPHCLIVRWECVRVKKEGRARNGRKRKKKERKVSAVSDRTFTHSQLMGRRLKRCLPNGNLTSSRSYTLLRALDYRLMVAMLAIESFFSLNSYLYDRYKSKELSKEIIQGESVSFFLLINCTLNTTCVATTMTTTNRNVAFKAIRTPRRGRWSENERGEQEEPTFAAWNYITLSTGPHASRKRNDATFDRITIYIYIYHQRGMVWWSEIKGARKGNLFF